MDRPTTSTSAMGATTSENVTAQINTEDLSNLSGPRPTNSAVIDAGKYFNFK